MKHVILTACLGLLFLSGCKEKPGQQSTDSKKPEAMGEIGKVVMLADDVTYTDSKDALTSIFNKSLEGLPGHEAYLNLARCGENDFTGYFKHNYNLVIVYRDDQKHKIAAHLGVELLKIIQDRLGKGESVFTAKDVFAAPQHVTFVVATDQEDLNTKIMAYSDKILELAMDAERANTIETLIRGKKETDAFFQNMMKQYGFAIRTPNNYTVSVRSDEFNGIKRSFGSDNRTGIYLYAEPFKGSQQFTRAYIINRRNDMLKKHLHGPDHPDSLPVYVQTDTINVPIAIKKIELNGYKAIEMRGWWEMVNNFMGGPFVSYTIYCPKTQQVVTIEGNVFAPSRTKQEHLRQIELTATTFEERQ